ncbi:MAG: hypothetical protein AAFR87_21290 [Bacteroidota bacterium]
MKLFIYLIAACLLLFSCNKTPITESTMGKYQKRADQKSGENRVIIIAEIVKKTFVNKAGKVTDKKEFYIRRSIQDYFIKFCESEVSSEELREAWEKETGFIKTLRIEVEFKEGNWDDCEKEEVELQSRVGEYAVLHRLI